MAPSVAGSDFIVFWTEIPVGVLFERIKVTMPEDGPGRLSDEEYTDVVAFMLEPERLSVRRHGDARRQGGDGQDHDRRRRVTSQGREPPAAGGGAVRSPAGAGSRRPWSAASAGASLRQRADAPPTLSAPPARARPRGRSR